MFCHFCNKTNVSAVMYWNSVWKRKVLLRGVSSGSSPRVSPGVSSRVSSPLCVTDKFRIVPLNEPIKRPAIPRIPRWNQPFMLGMERQDRMLESALDLGILREQTKQALKDDIFCVFEGAVWKTLAHLITLP